MIPRDAISKQGEENLVPYVFSSDYIFISRVTSVKTTNLNFDNQNKIAVFFESDLLYKLRACVRDAHIFK